MTSAFGFNSGARLARRLLLFLFLLCLPLFLCMPLWSDVTFFDIGARTILDGGVLHRDVFYHSLPGKIWLHLVIRSLVGWSSVALRIIDFLIISAVIYWLVSLVQKDWSNSRRLWIALAMYFFYFSVSEDGHAQPDAWMLLPALVALSLRQRQVGRVIHSSAGFMRLFPGSFLEGACWAAAFWIKPHVAVPALACWLAGTWQTIRVRKFGPAALDALGILVGGLVVSGLGIGVMMRTGEWPYFLETMKWNQDYFSDEDFLWRIGKMVIHLQPWGLLSLTAVPVAVVALATVWKAPVGDCRSQDRALLAAFYLGWFMQANFLQKQYAYHMVPQVFLALTLLAGQRWPLAMCWLGGEAAALFFLLALVWHPLLQPHRLAVWARCWREGSSPAIRDCLTLNTGPVATSWGELEQIEDYLKGRQVKEKDVMLFSLSTIPLYLPMNLQPPSRFVLPWGALKNFPTRISDIRKELRECPQKFVVIDMRDLGYSQEDAVKAMPSKSGVFPWTDPEVFRTGRYLVNQVDRKERH